MTEAKLRQIISEEIVRTLNEDYARGIPDFALSDVASDASEGLKRHLQKYIQTNSSDPVKQRQMFAAANQVLKELEKDLKEKMEEKLLQFIRMI